MGRGPGLARSETGVLGMSCCQNSSLQTQIAVWENAVSHSPTQGADNYGEGDAYHTWHSSKEKTVPRREGGGLQSLVTIQEQSLFPKHKLWATWHTFPPLSLWACRAVIFAFLSFFKKGGEAELCLTIKAIEIVYWWKNSENCWKQAKAHTPSAMKSDELQHSDESLILFLRSWNTIIHKFYLA